MGHRYPFIYTLGIKVICTVGATTHCTVGLGYLHKSCPSLYNPDDDDQQVEPIIQA